MCVLMVVAGSSCSNQSCGSKALSTDSVAIKASMYSRLGITLMHQNARPFLNYLLVGVIKLTFCKLLSCFYSCNFNNKIV